MRVILAEYRHGGEDSLRWILLGEGLNCEANDAVMYDDLPARLAEGEADLVVPYAVNEYERPLSRQLIHNLYVGILNLSFRLDLKAYNHLMLCRREEAQRFEIRTRSYSYQSEQLIKLIKSGATYVQVGVYDHFDNSGRKTKVFKIRNVCGVAMFYLGILYDVYVRGLSRNRRGAPARAMATATEMRNTV